MALHDLHHQGWFALDRFGARTGLPSIQVRQVRQVRQARGPRPGVGALRRHASGGTRLPPSRRLPLAKMAPAAFVRMVAGWLTGVLAVLALVLLVRFLG